jgi:ribosome-binding factor A
MSRSRQASQRQLRVGEEIRHALAQILARTEFRDPDLQDVNLTVTEVRISPDLKQATVFIVPLGGADSKVAVAALNRASGYIRGLLGQMVRLRFTPRLSFEHDDSFDQAQRIDTLLHRPEVRRDLDGEPSVARPDGDTSYPREE